MHARVLGFDPGTAHTGYSLITGTISKTHKEKPQLSGSWGVLRTSIDDADVRGRIDILGKEMSALIEDLKPTHIAIEDFTEQGKIVGKTYKEMSWLTEHMRMVGRAHGYEVAIYENGYWKKQTIGIIHATKVQVQHYVLHHVMGAEVLTKLPKSKNHIWDSVGVGNCMYQSL